MNEKITISSLVLGLMSLVQGSAQSATVQITDAGIRFTIDGSTPVAGTTGLLAVDGATIILQTREEINGFRAIRDAAVDAVLQIVFEERQKHGTNFTNTRA